MLSIKITYPVALPPGAESVLVAPATAVGKLLAAPGGHVEVPAGDGGLARSGLCRQQAPVCTRTHATCRDGEGAIHI